MPTSADLATTAQRSPAHFTVECLVSGYGSSPVVREVSLQAGRGEIAAVLGPNGSGKSTVLKAATGQLRVTAGRVTLAGQDVTNRPSEALARLGIGYVPQENDVFAPLTVHENLSMGGYQLSRRKLAGRIDSVLVMFPALEPLLHNAAGGLSGGERKLLAMARVLMTEPSVLLLDEPTANLSPKATKEILAAHVRRLADAGTCVVLVEQKALQALEVANWAYVLVAGSVLHSSSASDLAARGDIGELFLGKPATAAS